MLFKNTNFKYVIFVSFGIVFFIQMPLFTLPNALSAENSQCAIFLSETSNVVPLNRFKTKYSAEERSEFEYLIEQKHLDLNSEKLRGLLDYLIFKIYSLSASVNRQRYIELLLFARNLVFKIHLLTFPEDNHFELQSFPLIEKYILVAVKFAETGQYTNLKIALTNLKVFLNSNPEHRPGSLLLDKVLKEWSEKF